MIRVYDSNEKVFNNNGIKILHPLFAEITKTDNGDYCIELEDILENIDYWRKAPVWTPETIKDATADWFKYLGK